ncbi:LOW QUALITY PROTEIN: alpha-N-acetylglucosaminidase-like [Oppia nitens]|uniref:LOW QUALITY PROTEIN: alpha-N-acetylglucosaminidase-like n=1 Tax=Oppia nitens TaxID=1686743 RepID=UPI0023DC6BA1|nr:LOW QUALITY PROTEIN: alpha-N-acetylglucosaminidase-like [Oppia nitens]
MKLFFQQLSLGLLLLLLLLLLQSIDARSKAVNDLWLITSTTDPVIQANATKQLIGRLLPESVADKFQVVIDKKLLLLADENDYKDKFILESTQPTNLTTIIKITATSGVSAANGFHYYLKHYLNCHISWSGDQLDVGSGPLPIISKPVTIIIQDKLRYYQNVCTVSYSMVWWDFNRWQREIDWMAMNGINFPLAFNGQELIWRKVFQKFGLTVAEIDEYFTGPAFLAWNRMGNVEGWSGPLTDNWHKQQAILQARILERMRSFGMLPVLPAFAGHVPRNLTRVMPDARVSRLSKWGKFNDTYTGTYFLEPQDPHFVEIGSAFISEYSSMYGTDHFYNTDLFNEVTPKTKDTKYLADCGNAVYQSLAKADNQSVWVMQGWLFVNDPGYWHKDQAKALITSVPKGKLLILDLMSELEPRFNQLDGYYGQPFIWCMLHNFGGTIGMYGAFNHINSDVFRDRQKYDNMLGIGLTPEGIEQNPIVYEFMTETVWFNESMDLDKWVTDYARRRYGYLDDNLRKGWHLLQNSVYTDTVKVHNHGRYVINLRPTMRSVSDLWYKPIDVYKSYKLFLNATTRPSKLQNSHTFQYDLVDITRQSLQLIFDTCYHKLVQAYVDKNHTDFVVKANQLLGILDDMDDILATNENFLLGKWLNNAKQQAVGDQERHINAYQARNQITIWGPNANILDYACKHWSGLFADYYKPRWQLFIDTLNNH